MSLPVVVGNDANLMGLLNGEPITEAIELKDKDLIDVGRIEFLFVNEEVDDD